MLADEVIRKNHVRILIIMHDSIYFQSACASRCASSYVNFNQRVAMNFAQIQSKKMISAMEQGETQTPTNDTNTAQTLQDSRPS